MSAAPAMAARGRISAEAVAHANSLARLDVHLLHVRGERRVADLDGVRTRRYVEHSERRTDAAASAVNQYLAPGRDGELQARRAGRGPLLELLLYVREHFLCRRVRRVGRRRCGGRGGGPPGGRGGGGPARRGAVGARP